ncbi:sensor histidine kinase [Larkinella sp. VNQ87]|uniref:sensor histidine kinase n=1 Tax=Larkinella sp. VNQ87 TaxID=3400921 RepID=UPI003C10F4BE
MVILAMVYNIPFNYSIGLTEASLISLVLFLLFSFLYYLSRIKNKFYISITTAGILINLLLAINYFFNAGAVGSSLLLFMLVYFLLTIIAPARQYRFWFCFNLVVVFGLLSIEYLYPESIVTKYTNRLNQILDVASTYLVGVILIYLAMQFFRKAYRAEQRLVEQKSLVLEQLNAEKNKLFSIVSHDLRSPLASVQQYLEVIRETELSIDQKKQIEAELLAVVSHTQEMLFNLLSWSTTQMGGTSVNLGKVHVEAVLKPILEIYKPLSAKKGIELRHSIDPDLWVLADTNMLPLIVRNLIGNAIKFTPVGGLISVQTTKTGSECLIAVQDNGIGIDAAHEEAIFSLKSRSTFGTNHEKGVGLGLYLCKEYAEIQKGRLWFESQQGAGTTFYLALPLTR